GLWLRVRVRAVDKLGSMLPKVVRRQPGGARLMGTQVASAFMTLLGPDVARLCDEVELRSGTLLVTTSSPALAHQLRLDAQTILGRLNRPDLGRKVRTLRVRIGRSTPTCGWVRRELPGWAAHRSRRRRLPPARFAWWGGAARAGPASVAIAC